MNKAEIQQRLTESHAQFTRYIESLSDGDFVYASIGKWTAGQQTDHIIKSVSPVKTAFSLPHFLLKLFFGKANRPTRTYEALVEKYQQKLAAGGKAPSRFVPPIIQANERNQLLKKVTNIIEQLSQKANQFSENQLDTLLLPHPLLGKLTLREMLYFTIYHVGHHEKSIRESLHKRTT